MTNEPDTESSETQNSPDSEAGDDAKQADSTEASERAQLEVDILRDSLPSPENPSDSSDDTAQDKPSF